MICVANHDEEMALSCDTKEYFDSLFGRCIGVG